MPRRRLGCDYWQALRPERRARHALRRDRRLCLWVCPSALTRESITDCARSHSIPPTAVANNTITLRERDSTQQLIGSVDEVVELVRKLSEGTLDWEGATKVLPFYSGEQAL